MPIEDALAELQNCSGTQFDPILVKSFCRIIQSDHVRTTFELKTLSQDVMLSIGEQIERIAEAADSGDIETFSALTDRLRLTAEQSNLPDVAEMASHANEKVNEDLSLETVVNETFELLSICRSLHATVVTDAERSLAEQEELEAGVS